MRGRSSSWLALEVVVGGLLAVAAMGILFGASTRAEAEQRAALRDRLMERVLAANVDALAHGEVFITRASVGQTELDVTRVAPGDLPSTTAEQTRGCRGHGVVVAEGRARVTSRRLIVERCPP